MSAPARSHGELELSGEQEQLVETLGSAFGDVTRKAAAQGLEPAYRDETWAMLARDLEVVGVDIPEQYGGSGFSLMELGLTIREMGRVLLPSPYFSTVVIGVGVLLAVPDEEARLELLPRIAVGDLTLAVVLDDLGGSDRSQEPPRASQDLSRDWVVSGQCPFVLDGNTADLVIVSAVTPTGRALFLVDPSAPGVSRHPTSCLDATRPGAALRMANAPARPLGPGTAAPAASRSVRDRLLAAAACESVGAAQACLSSAVEFAKVRHQFGKPIGSFQSIKHRCADLHMEITAAESLALQALVDLSTGTGEASALCALAAAASAEALWHAAAANVQIHGGIGFTWEHSAHRYYRRAVCARTLFGSPRSQRLSAYQLLRKAPARPAGDGPWIIDI